jgi:hypothetical protein
MRAGLSQHQALAFILFFSVVVYAINYLLYGQLSSTIIVIIDILLYILVNTAINFRIKALS